MMARRSGRVVTIASIFGKHGGYGYITAYTASKHGVIGLTRALAAELGAQGYPAITVNAVCPGYVRAGMGIRLQHTKAGPLSGAEIFDRYFKRQVPLRRMVEADEIGHAQLQPGLAHRPRPGRYHAWPRDLEADDRRDQRLLSGRWSRAGAGLRSPHRGAARALRAHRGAVGDHAGRRRDSATAARRAAGARDGDDPHRRAEPGRRGAASRPHPPGCPAARADAGG